MLFVYCGEVRIISIDMCIWKLAGRVFEKNGKCKSDRHWLTKRVERYE